MFYNRHFLPRAVLVLVLTQATTRHTRADTITFEDLTGGTPFSSGGHFILNNYNAPLVEHGFIFQTTGNSPLAAWNSDAPAFYGGNYTGSIALFANTNGGFISLTQVGGSAFTLNSIDIANNYLQTSEAGSAAISFVGTKLGGGTVSQNYTPGLDNVLNTVTFNDFSDVVSVTWNQTNPFHQFDNVVLNADAATTPEPGSIALLTACSLTGAAFLFRKRAQK